MNKPIVPVLVDDGQMEWVADRDTLIAALDALGWEQTRRLIYPARVSPTLADDADPYTALCDSVPAIDAAPTDDMPRLAWHPAEGAWLWDRSISCGWRTGRTK